MKMTLHVRHGAVASVFLVAGTTIPGCGLTECPPLDDQPAFKSEDALVIAHRGGAGLWPENTLIAFQEAVALGVDVLEMDLRDTLDGELVIMHDETVDRTTDGTGQVNTFSLDEIQTLDAGYWWTNDDGATYPFRNQGIVVPTLEAVITEFPDERLNIEIKTGNLTVVEPFCDMLREHEKTADVLVVASDSAPIEAFRVACPDVATATSESEARAFFLSTILPVLGDCLSPAVAAQVPEFSGNTHVVTEGFVTAVHNTNGLIHVWTVNETEDMRRLIELGVDGIITDFPDRTLALLDGAAP